MSTCAERKRAHQNPDLKIARFTQPCHCSTKNYYPSPTHHHSKKPVRTDIPVMITHPPASMGLAMRTLNAGTLRRHKIDKESLTIL